MLLSRVRLTSLSRALESVEAIGPTPAFPAFIRASFLPAPGFSPPPPFPEACLSLADCGDMRYRDGEKNLFREAFFSALQLDPSAVLGTELFHTRNVLLVTASKRLHFGGKPSVAAGYDGILVHDPSLAPCVTVADCMPIWLFDSHSGAFGVLHSGWKGTGILAVAAGALAASFGSPPEAISAIFGPSVGPCCYVVPEERALSFRNEFGEESTIEEEGQFRLDLRAANLAIARSLGLGAVLSIESCTSCDARLGSYRRQGAETFTRMAAMAAILPRSSPAGSLALETAAI